MAYERASDLPSYESPPVHEVAVGIGFKELSSWNSVAPGEFRKFISDRFPLVEDKPPLAPMAAIVPSTQEVAIEMLGLPPVRRTWYLTEDSRSLLQIQVDRIHANWRRLEEADSYPRYDHVLSLFEYGIERLQAFVRERGEDIDTVSAEVTYVNHIIDGELWSSLDDLSRVFRDWNPVPSQLTTTSGVVAKVNFSGGLMNGLIAEDHTLSLELKTGLLQADNRRVLIMQLVDRCSMPATNKDCYEKCCGIGSENIVRLFTALTTEEAHKLWRRKR